MTDHASEIKSPQKPQNWGLESFWLVNMSTYWERGMPQLLRDRGSHAWGPPKSGPCVSSYPAVHLCPLLHNTQVNAGNCLPAFCDPF